MNRLILKELVKRDFQIRYAGSILGFLWSFALPLWQLVLYSLVFSKILKVSPVGERTDSFAIYLFCGLMPWLAVQEGVSRAATAITENAALVKKMRFPSETLIVAAVLGALLQEAISAVVFGGLLAAFGVLSWRGLPLLLLALPLQVALSLGLGFLFSAIQVFVRDLAQILGMVFSAWFYFTPIVYPISYVPEHYRELLSWNPMTALVALYRQAFLGGGWSLPPGTGWLCLCSALALGGGWMVFRSLRDGLVDEI